jgi:hypothetical protein
MSKRRVSIFGNVGRWLTGEVFLLCTALLLMSVFAFTSFSNAYVVALLVLAVALIALSLYRISRKKAKS